MTNTQTFGYCDLVIGYYLVFACLPVGREFGYWSLLLSVQLSFFTKHSNAVIYSSVMHVGIWCFFKHSKHLLGS